MNPSPVQLPTDLLRYPPCMSPAQVAEYLQLHRNTVYELLVVGTLRGRKLGATWRIPRENVARYMDLPEPIIPSPAARLVRPRKRNKRRASSRSTPA